MSVSRGPFPDSDDRLRLSVIVPTLNEAEHIAMRIAQARTLGGCEVIVVDGGSSDDTVARAAGADLILETKPGRAIQQNAAARVARGKVLLFLHSDCWLPAEASTAIEQTLSDPAVICGCFAQQIDGEDRCYRWLERGNAFRVKRLGWAYGDQALFFRRDQFLEQGGFPEIPFLEDWSLVRRLKRLGRIALVGEPRVHVDPRRWQQRGVVRQTVRNWMIVLAALCGVSPTRLARFYPHVR